MSDKIDVFKLQKSEVNTPDVATESSKVKEASPPKIFTKSQIKKLNKIMSENKDLTINEAIERLT